MNIYTDFNRSTARFIATLAMFAMLLSALPVPFFVAEAVGPPVEWISDPKVPICHATAASSNPFTNQIVDGSSIVGGSGHDSHDTKGLDDKGDIIPPFGYNDGTGTSTYPGKNWDTTDYSGFSGEEVYNNGLCNGGPLTPTTGIIIVQKQFAHGTDPVDEELFNFEVNSGASTVFESDGDNQLNDQDAGPYVIVETADADYTPSYDNCEFTLAAGETETCTITNTLNVKPTTGTLEITKYSCPADTVVVRSQNGVGGTLPDGCTLQEGATFGYVHGDQTDANGPYPEVGSPTEEEGATDANGLLSFELESDGRYLVVETDGSGNQLPSEDILGLYCIGDGDTSDNNDNQELTFITVGETTSCVAYNPAPPPVVCELDIVSDTTDFVVEKDADAVALSFVHSAWTAVIGGATWIWGDDPVSDPEVDETQTFQKGFGWSGTVTSATLEVASDNSHSADLNGSTAGTAVEENNFKVATQDSYDVTSLIQQGNNDLSIAVTNIGAPGTDYPAGLLYKLHIVGEETGVAGCSVPYIEPVDMCLNVDGFQETVPEDLVRDDNGNCNEPVIPACDYGFDSGNLLLNPSFEEPVIQSAWSISAITGWVITKVSDNTPTLGELWRGLGVGPSDGLQNVELAANEPTQLTQSVTTVEGATYELRFDFAARGTNVADNSIDALVDGNILMNANTGVTSWTTYSQTFVADTVSTDIAFRDVGGTNSAGSLLDNSVLCYVSDPIIPEPETYIIEGYVWHDDNENDNWDGSEFDERNQESEEEIEDEDHQTGWDVFITNGEGDDRATTTDINGYYYFDVPAGTWTVTEEVREGWTQTFPNDGSHVVTVGEVTQAEEGNFFATVLDYLIPTAHAAFSTYYNFGNNESPTASSGGGGGGGGGSSKSPRCDLFEVTSNGVDLTLAWETRNGYDLTISTNGTEIHSELVNSIVDDGSVTMKSDETEFELTVNRGSRSDTCSVDLDRPTPQVLGEQVSVVPTGAPDAGAGGATPVNVTYSVIPVAFVGRKFTE